MQRLRSMPNESPQPSTDSLLASTTINPLRNLLHQPPRQRQLVHARQRMYAGVVEQRDLVVVGAERVLRAIGDHQRHVLALALGFRVIRDVVAFSGETHAERTIG